MASPQNSSDDRRRQSIISAGICDQAQEAAIERPPSLYWLALLRLASPLPIVSTAGQGGWRNPWATTVVLTHCCQRKLCGSPPAFLAGFLICVELENAGSTRSKHSWGNLISIDLEPAPELGAIQPVERGWCWFGFRFRLRFRLFDGLSFNQLHFVLALL